jgi:hypothetical protein
MFIIALFIKKNILQKEKKLLEALKDQGIIRAHEDLQRIFYKALNELRRHQTWRHGTIELGQGT